MSGVSSLICSVAAMCFSALALMVTLAVWQDVTRLLLELAKLRQDLHASDGFVRRFADLFAREALERRGKDGNGASLDDLN